MDNGKRLPVVFGLVEEMSGTITLESELGAGTAVTIRFPCVPEQDGASDGEPELARN
jgi:signal transduction histidine kinase